MWFNVIFIVKKCVGFNARDRLIEALALPRLSSWYQIDRSFLFQGPFRNWKLKIEPQNYWTLLSIGCNLEVVDFYVLVNFLPMFIGMFSFIIIIIRMKVWGFCPWSISSSTECIRDLDWILVKVGRWLFFWSFLTTFVVLFEIAEAYALLHFDLCLQSNCQI